MSQRVSKCSKWHKSFCVCVCNVKRQIDWEAPSMCVCGAGEQPVISEVAELTKLNSDGSVSSFIHSFSSLLHCLSTLFKWRRCACVCACTWWQQCTQVSISANDFIRWQASLLYMSSSSLLHQGNNSIVSKREKVYTLSEMCLLLAENNSAAWWPLVCNSLVWVYLNWFKIQCRQRSVITSLQMISHCAIDDTFITYVRRWCGKSPIITSAHCLAHF